MKTNSQSTALGMRGLAAPLLLLLALSACGALPDGAEAGGVELAAGETGPGPTVLGAVQEQPEIELPLLRIGALEAESLDPAFAVHGAEREIASLVFRPLIELDDLARPIPGAARSWSSWDNVTWTFRLDPQGHFHNGELVTAESFIAGMMFLADPDNGCPNAYLGVEADIAGFKAMALGEEDMISGLAAADQHTLVITLNQPNSLLPSILAHAAFAPRSASALADSDAAAVAPIGNGPYSIVQPWDHASSVSLVPVAMEASHAVRFEFFDSAESMFQDASLDVRHVPGHRIGEFRDRNDDSVISRTVGSYNYIAFPAIEPFTDPDIRRALSLAIDREKLVAEVFAGSKAAADGFAPSGSMGSSPHDCASCVYDPDLARQLVNEVGGLGLETIELAFNTGNDHELWMQSIGAQWAEVFGVEVVFRPDGSAPYFEAIEMGTHVGPYRLGWSTDYPHAMSFLGPLFLAETNTAGYDDARVAEVTRKLMRLDNPYGEQGAELVSLITEQLNEDIPIVPVYADLSARVLSEGVSDVQLNLDGTLRLKDATLTR